METFDETNCDREPVAFINQIQPHGQLLLVGSDWKIRQVSSNVAAAFGAEPDQMIGQNCAAFLTTRQFEALTSCVMQPKNMALPIGLVGNGYAVCNIAEPFRMIEIEPPLTQTGGAHADISKSLKNCLSSISQQQDTTALAQRLAAELKKISGYDRVLVYKFHSDWHGEVIAEAVEHDWDSYYLQHFPASDIPLPARELFSKNWLRMIADVNAVPADLVPAFPVNSDAPADLTYSALRQPSRIHLEYLRNMNVAASLTLSLIVEGRLWGLVAFHHRKPRIVDYWSRSVYELIAKHASEELTRVVEDDVAYFVGRLIDVANALLSDASTTKLFYTLADELRSLFSAERAILLEPSGAMHGNLSRLDLPSVEKLKSLLEGKDFFVSDEMTAQIPGWNQDQCGSGLIATKLETDWLILMRAEYVRAITWAGDPSKPVDETLDDGRLHPRYSFANWKEEVRNKSLPWSESEIVAAQALALLFKNRQQAVRQVKQRTVARETLSRSIDALQILIDDPAADLTLRRQLSKMKADYQRALEQ